MRNSVKMFPMNRQSKRLPSTRLSGALVSQVGQQQKYSTRISVLSDRAHRATQRYFDDPETARLAEMFKLVDLNKDGLIDFADLNRLLKQLNIFATRKEVCAMIRAHDPNDIGGVNFENFCAMMKSSKPVPRDVEMSQIFHSLDRNGNGQITRAEAREALMFVEASVGKRELDEMFEALDTDKDGQIAVEEFSKAADFLESA
ncbi:hypothetical protein BOX15_Mlig001643g1 [Macrostomum lignano]|uniref:Uncharacterized protein n=2 Tax=Macrostomum lignano TaxID=282301 RepID=A0A267H636_9PLAT|nr:hypothetical protein BOX15_Mlig001643g1 [Macrostomum lignano]